jgi:RNA polymerase sigma factor (TIGR02999 family)
MTDVTQILSQIEDGDPTAAAKLLPIVYDELRLLAAQRLSNEKPGQTLQATALVHEAYLRLVGTNKSDGWNDRGHFFGAAAEAMRRVLVDNARRKNRTKHGGEMNRANVELEQFPTKIGSLEIEALDEALKGLADEHPEKARLVELRYFCGLTVDQAAKIMEISRVTANRHWTFAKAWLHAHMRNPDNF